jgi:pyruvate kinase
MDRKPATPQNLQNLYRNYKQNRQNIPNMSSFGECKKGVPSEQLKDQYLSQAAGSFMEAKALLDIDSKPQVFRGTKIICTIGPACREVNTLQKMITAGMDIARLNFSHGNHDYHKGTIANIREAIQSFKPSENEYKPCAIALDTKGPEIRSGLLDPSLNGKDLEVFKGQKLKLTTNPDFKEKCCSDQLYIDYDNITHVISIGDKIFIDDGLICLEVLKFDYKGDIETEVLNNGLIGSRKGINLPGVCVDLPAISEKDKLDLTFGIEQNVDMVFASFIRKAKDVKDIRNHLGEKGSHIRIISKIENQEGVQKIDEIINESDGIMVARGDMGIEIPAHKVFIAQKMIIARCNAVGKPVICATQMLESMTKAPRPTRAEVSDVANAVIDGSDCIMLSGETAKGEYPIQSVEMQHLIAREAEPAIYHRQVFEDLRHSSGFTDDCAETVAVAVVEAAMKCRAAAIITLTTSGKSAHLISKYRPQCPIIAVTRYERTARQFNLYRGIIPVEYFDQTKKEPWSEDVEARVQKGINVGKHRQFLHQGQFIVIVTGWRPGAGATNTMRIELVP